MSRTLHLVEALIACRSLTPEDAGCQPLIAERLRAVGFHCETLECGPADFRVTNLWARRPGHGIEACELARLCPIRDIEAQHLRGCGRISRGNTGP